MEDKYKSYSLSQVQISFGRRLLSLRNLVLFLGFLALNGCSSSLYYPSRALLTDISTLKPKPEDIFIKSSHSHKIHGWYFKSPKPSKARVILFHGNGENLSTHFHSLFWMVKEGFDLFAFSYQGYGRSEGDPSPEDCLADGKAALDWLLSQKPAKPVVVVGQSLGGAVAMRTIADYPDKSQIKLLMIESSFLSYRAAARGVLSQNWFTWLGQPLTYLVLSDKHAPLHHLKDIPPVPLLVVHESNDRTVPFELGKEVYDEASEPKEFWPLEGEGHISAMKRPEFRKRFLEYVLKKLI